VQPTLLQRIRRPHSEPIRPIQAHLLGCCVLGQAPFAGHNNPARMTSLTFDRGTKFVSWPHLQAGIGTQAWFYDPSSPWQKGTAEITNQRVLRWLPRKRDIRSITDENMKAICDRLNNTPRRCLGWKTPAEVFREKMMEELGRPLTLDANWSRGSDIAHSIFQPSRRNNAGR